MLLERKVCTKCGIEKSLNKFYKDGIKSRAECKDCTKLQRKLFYIVYKKKISVRRKTYYKDNREKILVREKIYQGINKEKISVRKKKYCEDNKNQIIEAGKKYYKKNKKRISEQRRIYGEQNKAKIKNKNQNYYKVNKEKIKAANKTYYQSHKKELGAVAKQKYKEDPKIRLNQNIRERLRFSLKGNKAGRHWEDLVGYTFEKLKKHLEKQFTKGMSWETYGKGGWVIDHKIPIVVFNFTKPEHRDFKGCWALKNLQPMWAKENQKKHAKLTKHFQPSLLIQITN